MAVLWFYRLLVLTLGGVLLAAGGPGRRLGAVQIVGRILKFIDTALTRAGHVGQLDARICPYHYDLHDYVGLAVHVMMVCR